MKIPVTPPPLSEVLSSLGTPEAFKRLAEVLSLGIGPAPGGKYRHWDKLRHITPPDGLTSAEWWAAIKFARSQIRREFPLRDRNGKPFTYSTPDPVLELLHAVDRDASGQIAIPEQITNPQTKDRYLQSSLIEEAITSSQLEGAAATREQAKEMIRFGRKPIDKGELMILNNYRAMQLIGEYKREQLTPELVFNIHQVISAGTLHAGSEPPHLRRPGDGIAVYDQRDNELVHLPPHASEIPGRLEAMCEFANSEPTGAFLHPVVKAVLLHFWLSYDHPFVDGNGRTARALFYWIMLSQGYWLTEYISISRILRRAPAKYSRSFLYTETDENDATYFIHEQLAVIMQAIDSLKEYLARKVGEVRRTEALLRGSAGLNHRQLALISHALRHPGTRYTIKSHQTSHDVTYETARTDLLGLNEKGLLSVQRSGRAFIYTAVSDLDVRIREL
jgi:Fic family protein